MATGLNLLNGYGVCTYNWTYIPAGKSVSVTCCGWDNAATDDPVFLAGIAYTAATKAGSVAPAAAMSTAWRFEGTTLLLRTSSGLLASGSHLVPITGTAASSPDISPLYSTWVVSKGTPFAGRAQRGRMYPPFTLLSETGVDANGTIGAGSVATYQAQWSTWFADVPLNSSFRPYLVHSFGSSAVTPQPIVSIVVKGVVGIQRRRRARGA